MSCRRVLVGQFWMFWRTVAGVHLVALYPRSGDQAEMAVGRDLADMLGAVLAGWREDAEARAEPGRAGAAGELSEWLF